MKDFEVFYITRVEIEGFWGKHKAVSNFYSDVNILIGKNGSGKTTFMNILEGVLRVDIRMLATLSYRQIRIQLKDRQTKSTRTIVVSKSEENADPFELITFRIANRTFPLRIYTLELDASSNYYRRRPRLLEERADIERQISSLVQVSSLSVHRAVLDSFFSEDYLESRRVQRIQKPPIDQRLEELLQRLTAYQLTLAENAAEVSSQFQKQVLLSILYDPDFDRFDPFEEAGVELTKERDDLLNAFRELNALDASSTRKINAHIRILRQSLLNLKKSRKENRYQLEDIMPLSLLRRTQHISQLSTAAEQQKLRIYRPVRQYLEVVQEFITDKRVSISAGGEVAIHKEDKSIAIADLSSGEKQILILLTETLLQQANSVVFFADEPELSLHIEWQEKIIDSIRRLNPNSQVIVATHSPEIAGGWDKNLMDMQEIVHA